MRIAQKRYAPFFCTVEVAFVVDYKTHVAGRSYERTAKSYGKVSTTVDSHIQLVSHHHKQTDKRERQVARVSIQHSKECNFQRLHRRVEELLHLMSPNNT